MKIARIIGFGALAAIALALPAVAMPLYFANQAAVLGYLVPPKVIDDGSGKAEGTAEGNELSKKAVAEGSVLLKNDGTLPLNKEVDSSVSIIGYHSVSWLHGGSGSGMVSPNPDDEGMSGIIDAFEDYGIETFADISDYYRDSVHRPDANPNINTLNFNRDTNPHKFDLYDPEIEGVYEDLLFDARDFSDTAIVVIGRQGGESEDMPEVQYKADGSTDESRHDLQLSEEEEDLISFAAEHFSKTIVIVNSTNAFQMDFLEDIPGINAAFLIGPTGCQGAKAIPSLLYGEVSPSGHLADTLPYDFTQNLNFEYCGYEGVSFFSNTAEYGTNQNTNAGVTRRPSLPYVDYVEGIYVGYRYYETADAMGKFDGKTRKLADGTTATGYDALVQFPFGYGLSYTDFKWTVDRISLPAGSVLTSDSEIEIDVIVENAGEVAGKDVVELYLDAPYKSGGIEKSATKLVDFGKTGTIEPGKTEVVTLRAKARDFASYDCYDKNHNGKATYEIDEGDYTLRLGTDSHHTKKIDFVTSSSIDGRDKDAKIDYHVTGAIILDKDPHTGTEIRNLFTGEDAIDGRAIDGLDVEGWNIPYVSRDNMPSAPVTQNSTHDNATGRAMDQVTLSLVTFAGASGTDATKANAWNEATVDEFGDPVVLDDFYFAGGGDDKLFESDGLTLTELGEQLGTNFFDAEWDYVLSGIDYSSAVGLVNSAHPNTKSIAAIGYPAETSLDGPAQIGSFNAAARQIGVGFPCDSVLAQTWNKELVFEVGLEMGNQMNEHGIYGVYGCGMNIHRDPFGGRNYEYFSEDPFLTGSLASNYARGVKLQGRLPVVKHFACAETETSRDSLYTYMSEQTLREIYLEPFRIVIEGEGLCEGAKEYKEAGEGYQCSINSLMTSYNRVGAVWAGGSAALMKGVLYREWGFHGEVITDWSDFNQYMNMDQAIRNGGNLGMSVSLRQNYRSAQRAVMALRDAIKNVIYANLRTRLAYEDYHVRPYEGHVAQSRRSEPGTDWVTPVVIVFGAVHALGAIAIIYFGALGHPGLGPSKKIED